MPRRKRISSAFSKSVYMGGVQITRSSGGATYMKGVEKTYAHPCEGQTQRPPRHYPMSRNGRIGCRFRTKVSGPEPEEGVRRLYTAGHKCNVSGTNLWIRKMIKGLLICGVSLLEIILHEIAVSEGTPDFAILLPNIQSPLEKVDGLCLWVDVSRDHPVDAHVRVKKFTLTKSSLDLAMEATCVRARSESGL